MFLYSRARALRVPLIMLAMLATALPALAQQSGQVRGVVSERDGSRIAAVTVTLAPGEHRTLTNDAGEFWFRRLPPGRYRIALQRFGYAALRRVPGGVALIEPRELRSTRQANLSDVLRFTPGVLTQGRWGAADESQLSIRGTNAVDWSAPERVHEDNWVFPGCPHAGPSIQVDAQGVLHAVWWTAAEKNGGVFYSQSADHGATFSEPVAIDPQAQPRASHAQLATAPDGSLVVAWDQFGGGPARVLARRSTDGGKTFGPAMKLSETDLAAAFPVVAVSGDRILVAWSEEDPAAIEHREAAHDAAVKEGKPVPLQTAAGARVMVRSALIR